MQVFKELESAYRNTNYLVSVGDKIIALKIGEMSDDLMGLIAAADNFGAVFITAWNPFSKALSTKENAYANERLLSELKEIAVDVFSANGVSADGEWSEDSYFATGVSALKAKALCISYEQNAVVFVPATYIPELIFHPTALHAS